MTEDNELNDHCNPENFITRSEHIEQCNNRMKWAEEVVATSKNDRRLLWEETDKIDKEVQALAGLVTKFQWWFIGILVAIIISSYVMPKLTANGTHKTLEEMNMKINILMDKQLSTDSIVNEIRGDQVRQEAKEKK
jgi:hypothetical protein